MATMMMVAKITIMMDGSHPRRALFLVSLAWYWKQAQISGKMVIATINITFIVITVIIIIIITVIVSANHQHHHCQHDNFQTRAVSSVHIQQ